MSAQTVTLGADITSLKGGMAAAAHLVAASARRMSAIGASGLAGIGKGGAAALEGGFVSSGTGPALDDCRVMTDWNRVESHA